jgi:ATP-dependent exoDNAse (exonuclease V) beta subunit
VLRGVIDLAFRETAGWVIVDYKSERVDRSAIPALAKYYRPQLESYARVWRQIVKAPVVECGLFFTHTGEYVPL